MVFLNWSFNVFLRGCFFHHHCQEEEVLFFNGWELVCPLFLSWRTVVTHMLIHFPILPCSLVPKEISTLSPLPTNSRASLFCPVVCLTFVYFRPKTFFFLWILLFPLSLRYLFLLPTMRNFRGKRAIYVIFIMLAGNTSLITCGGGIPSFTGRK